MLREKVQGQGAPLQGTKKHPPLCLPEIAGEEKKKDGFSTFTRASRKNGSWRFR